MTGDDQRPPCSQQWNAVYGSVLDWMVNYNHASPKKLSHFAIQNANINIRIPERWPADMKVPIYINPEIWYGTGLLSVEWDSYSDPAINGIYPAFSSTIFPSDQFTHPSPIPPPSLPHPPPIPPLSLSDFRNTSMKCFTDARLSVMKPSAHISDHVDLQARITRMIDRKETIGRSLCLWISLSPPINTSKRHHGLPPSFRIIPTRSIPT